MARAIASRWKLAFGAAVLGGQCAVSAAQSSEDPVDARDAVARLASDAWTERIAASSDLSDLARSLEPEEALRVLESALTKWIEDSSSRPDQEGDLAEVLARFEAAALEAFTNAPRAGLGVTYDTSPAEHGVRIGGTVRGFDAFNKLRDGDVVLAFCGTPVESGSMDLPVAIASYLPGETSRLTLIRGGEQMEVEVILGSRVDLRAARPLDMVVLRRAWAQRMDRIRGEAASTKIDTDEVRSIMTAPATPSRLRARAVAADVSLGGVPGEMAARRAGVVVTAQGNNAQAELDAELKRLNAELSRIVRRAIGIEENIRQIEVELRMIADTAEGRALRDVLRQRLIELRQDLVPIQQEQRRLMQERVEVIRALSQ